MTQELSDTQRVRKCDTLDRAGRKIVAVENPGLFLRQYRTVKAWHKIYRRYRK